MYKHFMKYLNYRFKTYPIKLKKVNLRKLKIYRENRSLRHQNTSRQCFVVS